MDFYKEIKEYSQQNLRACQLKQLAILEEIDKICKRHKIEYWLDGGTLLGAVRMAVSYLGMTISISVCRWKMKNDSRRLPPRNCPTGSICRPPNRIREARSLSRDPRLQLSLYRTGRRFLPALCKGNLCGYLPFCGLSRHSPFVDQDLDKGYLQELFYPEPPTHLLSAFLC